MDMINENIINKLIIQINDYETSLEIVNDILKDDMNNVDALNTKGIILMKLEEYMESEKYFKKSGVYEH